MNMMKVDLKSYLKIILKINKQPTGAIFIEE